MASSKGSSTRGKKGKPKASGSRGQASGGTDRSDTGGKKGGQATDQPGMASSERTSGSTSGITSGSKSGAKNREK